jgi:Fur family ferric uptake transcriptional regulator
MAMETRTLKQILHKEGFRYTPQRQMVWDTLGKMGGHHDCEEIYDALREKGNRVSRATVYRTIEVLARNGLLKKLEVGDGVARYEVRNEDEHHDHMICLETGDIIEFYDKDLERLQEEIVQKHGYTLVRHVHQLFVRKKT